MPLADLRTAWGNTCKQWRDQKSNAGFSRELIYALTWVVVILSFRSCSVKLGTARDLGFDTRVNPNLLKEPGSDGRESVSDREWSESENPGGGAKKEGREDRLSGSWGAGHT